MVEYHVVAVLKAVFAGALFGVATLVLYRAPITWAVGMGLIFALAMLWPAFRHERKKAEARSALLESPMDRAMRAVAAERASRSPELEAQEEEELKAWKEKRRLERQRWRSASKDGPYSVQLTGTAREVYFDDLRSTLFDLGVDYHEASPLIERAQHIGPQTLFQRVSERDAIEAKKKLEAAGGKVAIREALPAGRPLTARRESIPEHVRHEVWRRDEGRCVDCGSQELLEFDHIIPVSAGGANTARNLQLRCEPCNRRKGARI